MIDRNLVRSVLGGMSLIVWCGLLAGAGGAVPETPGGGPAASSAGLPASGAGGSPLEAAGSVVKAEPPPDVKMCSSAVDRITKGNPNYNAFVWDHDDPRKYIHSTLMLSTEYRGKLVPIDYTLILVGQLRQRHSGHLVEASGVCGMRGGRIISVRVTPSPPRS